MLLAIDIGNTNIVIGFFEGEELRGEVRLKTEVGRTMDEYAASLYSLFERRLGAGYAFEHAVISSVVPPMTSDIVRLVEECFSAKCLVIGPGTKSGIPIRIEDPRTAGADRIVNAVAMKRLYGSPGLVVDFGTATTFDYIAADGAYEGGVIAPGIGLSIEALVRNTAKLPKVELEWPKRVVGRSTVACMQSGAMVGYVCMVDGLIEKIVEEQGNIPHIVATGGFGRIVTEHSKKVRRYDPHLTLKGLQILHAMNLEKGEIR